jgi:hypothetical protein
MEHFEKGDLMTYLNEKRSDKEKIPFTVGKYFETKCFIPYFNTKCCEMLELKNMDWKHHRSGSLHASKWHRSQVSFRA